MIAILAELVSQIGYLKDKSEIQILIAEAAHSAGLNSAKVERISLALAGPDDEQTIDHQALATKYQTQLNHSNLIGAIRQWFEREN